MSSPAPRAKAARDYRLDFFRGLALVFILIDHIPDNIVSRITLHSFAFCDAAEVFIFISGYTAALAYAPVFEREGLAMAVARIYRRVWQLFVAHLLLFVIFNAEVGYTIKVLDNPLFADELAVGDYLNNPGEAFIRVLLLQFQPTLLNILPLYIVLLLALPWLLLVMRRSVWFGLIPSAVLWVAATLTGWNLPGFPEGRYWYLNPLCWQFLFIIAVAMSLSRGRIPEVRRFVPAAAMFAVLAACISFVWVLHDLFPRIPEYPVLPETWFDKTMLPPARLLNLLALIILVSVYVPSDWSGFRSRAGWLVITCGQNSLEVFCLTIVLAVLANLVLTLTNYTIPTQIIVNLVCLSLMVGFGLLLAWYKGGGRLPKRPQARVTP